MCHKRSVARFEYHWMLQLSVFFCREIDQNWGVSKNHIFCKNGPSRRPARPKKTLWNWWIYFWCPEHFWKRPIAVQVFCFCHWVFFVSGSVPTILAGGWSHRSHVSHATCQVPLISPCQGQTGRYLTFKRLNFGEFLKHLVSSEKTRSKIGWSINVFLVKLPFWGVNSPLNFSRYKVTKSCHISNGHRLKTNHSKSRN